MVRFLERVKVGILRSRRLLIYCYLRVDWAYNCKKPHFRGFQDSRQCPEVSCVRCDWGATSLSHYAIISVVQKVFHADQRFGKKRMNLRKAVSTWLFVFAVVFAYGCGHSADTPIVSLTEVSAPAPQEPDAQTTVSKPAKKPVARMAGMGKMKFPAPADMKFKDKIQSNAKVPTDLSQLSFVTKDGSTIRLSDFRGKQNVVLVFTEGFNGMLCPFCTTQTSRLVANYQKFKDRDCEIIVVYPGPAERVGDFIEAAMKTEKTQVDKVPFPIVLDKEFTATDYFDIHSRHAHPSTYLIDKQGGIQFAYVGKDMTADRPSIKAILDKLDGLEN